MKTNTSTRLESATPRAEPKERFAANAVRLSPRGWLIAGMLTLGVYWIVPGIWQTIEPLDISADYRIPFRLGNDYWHYERVSRAECNAGEKILLLGDSVLWGHYVNADQTLSHYLTEASNGHVFANLGVDGIHPVALCGLIEHFADAVRDKRVLLHCNLLWISSRQHDLSSYKETPFNHPALVPQFATAIPCYRATLSERLGTVTSRYFTFLRWADHLRIAYFGSDDLPTWTLSHPYRSPLDQVTLRLPSPNELPSPTPDIRPWDEKGLRPVNPDWVPLDDSLQWRFFQRTVRRLRERGNQVFVLIGPLNEHMLTEQGRKEYDQRKQAIAEWHEQQGIPHAAIDALPSHMYADLSHPVARGYQLLAERLLANAAIQKFLVR